MIEAANPLPPPPTSPGPPTAHVPLGGGRLAAGRGGGGGGAASRRRARRQRARLRRRQLEQVGPLGAPLVFRVQQTRLRRNTWAVLRKLQCLLGSRSTSVPATQNIEFNIHFVVPVNTCTAIELNTGGTEVDTEPH